MTDVEREVILPATPAQVWEEFADPERLGEWFGAEVDGEIAEGEILRFDGERAVVERADPARRLTFRYLGDDTSRVDITIDEIPDGSIVRVVERRIESAVTPRPQIGFKALAKL
ncbi:MAG TPA: SRPBCC domain-containing protein [Actinomycetota bacterium]|nr:SRPBCC domain-containing protein [Actinomycetota bacterium]